MNAQEIFDTVAKHLAAQGGAAIDSVGSCRYRGNAGRKCAVGILIPDEDYNDAIEGKTFGAVAEECREATWAIMIAPHQALVSALQRAHDAKQGKRPDGTFGLYDERPIVDRLRAAAELHDVSPAILDALTFPDVWK